MVKRCAGRWPHGACRAVDPRVASRPARHSGNRIAFTLVELLVVLAVVALLVALLMPALGRARESANRVRCLATLRSMAQAAHSHASDHRGYMPVAGPQGPTHLGVTATPEGLRDAGRTKYIYYEDRGSMVLRPVPLLAALGYYMNLRQSLDPFAGPEWELEQKLQSNPLLRHFSCPSQDTEAMQRAYVTAEGASGCFPQVRMSYIFNATVLARQIYVWGETPAGQLTSIRHPSTVFLFADGKPAVDNDFRGYSVSAAFAPQETMSASFNYYRRQYDLQRHRGKMNVVFVDGHAETLQMPVLDVEAGEWRQTSDFENVGVSLGIFD